MRLATPFELYTHISSKGYVAPMQAQVIIDQFTIPVEGKDEKVKVQFTGTGEVLKQSLELDRINVFKSFYGEVELRESSWLAGEEPGKGMVLPLWQERLIHADIMVSKESIDTTIDFLLYDYGKGL
jgi:hypothetical protein